MWALALVLLAAAPASAQDDPARAIDLRVDELVSRMTRAEKFWQLYMSPGDRSDPSHDYASGSFGLQIPEDTTLAPAEVARDHAQRINRLQAFFVDSTRLGIPPT